MKVKTSITLSEATLRAVDKLAAKGSTRSQVIEDAVVAYLAARRKAARDRKDLAILNRRAEELNREVADVLDLQDVP